MPGNLVFARVAAWAASGMLMPALAGLACFCTPALGEVLGKGQLLIPLAPKAHNLLSVPSTIKVDPTKPVWVAYSLMTVSAMEKPTGAVLVESALEGIKVPLPDSVVGFHARDMLALPRTGTLQARLDETVGAKSPEVLAAAFGPDLYAAYQAVVAKKGAIHGKTIVKVFAPTGREEVTLLASISKATELQPVVLSATIGQGEIPAELKDAFGAYNRFAFFNEKLVAALVAAAIAAVYLYRRFTR